MGRIIKRDGRWVVQAGDRSSGWTTRGSAARSCPPWAAAGAAYLMQAETF